MSMGLAAGGRMRQEIYDDPYPAREWDRETRSRCFVHICNSERWRAVTGLRPPTHPPTAREYSAAGLPWFEYYSEAAPIDGSDLLAGLRSVTTLARRKRVPLENDGIRGAVRVVRLRAALRPGQVREWEVHARKRTLEDLEERRRQDQARR
jgi:hypothetical protein